MSGMGRREFVALLGGAAAAWPVAARAQQAVVHSGSQQEWAHAVAAFQGSLKEAGYVVDQNLRIAYRWAEDQYDRLPALAADWRAATLLLFSSVADHLLRSPRSGSRRRFRSFSQLALIR